MSNMQFVDDDFWEFVRYQMWLIIVYTYIYNHVKIKMIFICQSTGYRC